MRKVIVAMSLLVGFGTSLGTSAAEVKIYDRVTHHYLPTYRHDGRLYVAGEPRHEYEIRIRNVASQRMLAVTTVDGVNVITGQTGSPTQSGYVLDAYGTENIQGWRKSLSHTAAFFFTELKNSYAARTGRPEHVGVIGVALFPERPPLHRMPEIAAEAAQDATRSSALNAPSAETRAKKSADKSSEFELGTGHGVSEYSAAQYTEFERASDIPAQTIVVYYDSMRNLIAQGIVPQASRYADRLPQAFPEQFTPDP